MKDVLYSVAYCLGFVLFALTAGGLGAVIPVKADDLGLPETDFGTLFIFKGAGGFVGGLLGLALEKVMGLHTAMAISFSVIGVCSVGVHMSAGLLSLDLLFLLIETAGMVMNICSTVCIFRLHGSRGEPWIKSLHFCYGVGAFLTPLVIGQLGMAAYSIYACVAVPMGLFMLLTKEKQADTVPLEMKEDGQASSGSIPEAEIPLDYDVILAAFLLCGTGNEASYGGWITSYGTMSGVPTKNALLGASIFWMSMTAGRGLLIPLSSVWNARQQLSVLTAGILFSVGLCNLFSYLGSHLLVIYLCSIVAGLFMSGIYPLTMSMPNSIGLKVAPKNTSRYVLGGCVGGALVPFLVGLTMKHFGAGSMFVSMVWVLFLMILVFRRLLARSDTIMKPTPSALTAEALGEEPGAQSPVAA